MTADPAGTARCPTCGATVRVGDPWCTLCYADLRPAAAVPATPAMPAMPAPAPPVEADPTYAPAGAAETDPLTAPLQALSGPTWPCEACGTINPMADDTCSACGRHFLAGVREQQAPLLVLPVVGDITKVSRANRYALAFGVVLVVALVTLLLGVLVG